MADDRLDDLETPPYITLMWDDKTDDWDVTTNMETEDVAAGLSVTLFRLAIGDHERRPIE